MKASVFLSLCEQKGISFYAGVPDSQLRGLCDELYDRFGTSGQTHIVAPDEGGAIALCAGHYLSTGRPGLCYMQNSGLGNAVNPLASLMDPAVYALPCLLVVGWRGEPGVHDEPQHVKQGAVTLGQLELLGIPYTVLSANTSDEAFAAEFDRLSAVLGHGRCAAVVVRKGALVSERKPSYKNSFTMTREEAAGLILSASGDDDLFVSTTGKLSREVFELREARGQAHDRDFLTVGSMGHASLIALKLALSLPGRRVWCLDGDGAALMHLGALPLIGRMRPMNLIHVVIDNGAHETVGGMPVNDRALDWPSLGNASGYPAVLSAADPASLSEALSKAVHTEGPALLIVRCACGARADLGRPTTTPVQNRNAFMRRIRGEKDPS